MEDVIIVGGGPVGLLLACELKLAGADPLVLEAADGERRRTRSLGLRSLNARTMQSLALRGLVEPVERAQWEMLDNLSAERQDPGEAGDVVALMLEILRKGQVRGHFAGLPILDPEGNAQYVMLRQDRLEELLAERATAMGVRIRQGCAVTDVVQDGSSVTAVLDDGRAVRGAYLAGCDGGRSVVRKRAGFAFDGTPPTMTGRTAVAELADPSMVTSSLRGPGGLVNLSLVPGEIATIEFDGGPGDRDTPVTAAELQDSLQRVTGKDVVVRRLVTGIRYSDNARHAESYRKGRVLLAGDAAHVHSPIGGQGLNLGLQDAFNLGWRLGLVARGAAPQSLLDRYTAERHPVAARVLRNARAQVALMRPGAQVDALREVLGEVIGLPEAWQHFAGMMDGTAIDYAPGAAVPLTGRFVPAGLPLTGPAGVAELLRDGHGLLIGGSVPGVEATGPGARPGGLEAVLAGHGDRVRFARAEAGADLGGASALLVRPDGYVAWAGEPDGARDALTTWFGPPAAAAA
ncbi:2-polyprenyl-6-methoxyphenol hydroxylase [Nonomuraea sp. FMUSA5-5]|uniref:2-polyprenyl-6-methoxyphenol hydroxylase n=1 Tax=Nonomuraea composti TaxID=2720023 RepID=A0ABX1AYM0_9ACTN|nr:FAD-dependent monooxygenase [Nonomuraea sp. FMUSA5-5]NJP87996.1 2-polyprenyl-6-methoxyphenol hydroxylase [Nonomuraea sp. FMUSA5-5]